MEISLDPYLLQSFLSIACAAGLGALIGLEREVHGQPAGLRTHMILSIGAALAAILSISYSQFLSNPNFQSDPGRIVAQVVSGVGFLGAGAILRLGVTVRGLTTASSLWTTAIVGIACGSGYHELALMSSILVLCTLTIISRIERLFLTSYKTNNLKVTIQDRQGIVKEIRGLLTQEGIKVSSVNVSMPNKTTLKLSMIVRRPVEVGMDRVINILNSVTETQSMEIE